MNALVLEKQAQQEENQARKVELLLEASEEYLLLSKQDPANEKKYLAKAIQLYQQYESLDSIKYVDNIKQVQNKVTFDSIGGLTELKEEIKLKIIEPIKNPDIFRQFGKKAGGGILMYGPPGCGKSLIAEAAANEAGATFINVKPSDLKHSLVGETEKKISQLFETARAKAPCIIFFDEFEAIGTDRSKTDKHTKNFMSQLLQEMNGVGNKGAEILLLAATNTPWDIDPALMRHGRFGTSIYVPEPDYEARKQILYLHLQNKPIDNSINLDFLAEVTKGYTGADLAELVEMASDIPIKEYFKTKQARAIKAQDFMTCVKKKKSILNKWYSLAKQQIRLNNQEEYYSQIMKHEGYNSN